MRADNSGRRGEVGRVFTRGSSYLSDRDGRSIGRKDGVRRAYLG